MTATELPLPGDVPPLDAAAPLEDGLVVLDRALDTPSVVIDPAELRQVQHEAREAVSALLDDPTTPSLRHAHQAVATYLERERLALRDHRRASLARDALRRQHEIISNALVAVLEAPPARQVLVERASRLRHVLLRHISVSHQLLTR